MTPFYISLWVYIYVCLCVCVYIYTLCVFMGFPGGSVAKNLPAKAGDRREVGLIAGSDPCVRKIPWRRAGQPTPVFLPGESHGQRSLEATAHGVGVTTEAT